MRTPSLTTLPTEPIEGALGTAREVALAARDKGIGLLESDTAQDLLRRGQTVAIVARDRGVDLLDSDTAHELRRRGRGVVQAARGELIAAPTRSRKPLGLLLFAAGAAAGVVAAIATKKMSTTIPRVDVSYDDPSAQFPTKDGVIDLTSVAAEEGVSDTPVDDLSAMGDVEIGTETGSAASPSSKAKPKTPGKSS